MAIAINSGSGRLTTRTPTYTTTRAPTAPAPIQTGGTGGGVYVPTPVAPTAAPVPQPTAPAPQPTFDPTADARRRYEQYGLTSLDPYERQLLGLPASTPPLASAPVRAPAPAPTPPPPSLPRAPVPAPRPPVAVQPPAPKPVPPRPAPAALPQRTEPVSPALQNLVKAPTAALRNKAPSLPPELEEPSIGPAPGLGMRPASPPGLRGMTPPGQAMLQGPGAGNPGPEMFQQWRRGFAPSLLSARMEAGTPMLGGGSFSPEDMLPGSIGALRRRAGNRWGG
jgi:hypothetical protein